MDDHDAIELESSSRKVTSVNSISEFQCYEYLILRNPAAAQGGQATPPNARERQASQSSTHGGVVVSLPDDEESKEQPRHDKVKHQESLSLGQQLNSSSPLEICQSRLRKAIKTRVLLAFEQIDFNSITNSEQLQQVLTVCEQFVTDLKYVAYRVQPCFPPEFHVLQLYVQCYEECVMQRMDLVMDSMVQIVNTEPQAVLTFNKFVAICKETQ